MRNHVERVYAGQASKRHYWNEKDSRQGECDNRYEPLPLQSRAESGKASQEVADTQIEKFYRKYGEDWIERYKQNAHDNKD